MKIEQIKFNAESIKKKGLDKKIIEIAKEAYEESKHQWCGEETHILNEKPIAQILGLFGGSIKGMKVLDLGCGYGGFNDCKIFIELWFRNAPSSSCLQAY